MKYDHDFKPHWRWLFGLIWLNVGIGAGNLWQHHWLVGFTSMLWSLSLLAGLKILKLMQQERERQRDHIRLMEAMIEEIKRR
jgi:hypothetical protein